MNSASKKRKYRSKVDRDFMAFVRWLPCFLCFRELYEFFDKEPWALVEMIANELIPEDRQKSPTEAAHLGLSTSRRGISQKFPVRECGPLCNGHHQSFRDAHHAGTKTFWERQGIDRDWIIGLVIRLWEAKQYRGFQALPPIRNRRALAVSFMACGTGWPESQVKSDPHGAYRLAARACHPDTGGSNEKFHNLQSHWSALNG